jgi:hypothetical protein
MKRPGRCPASAPFDAARFKAGRWLKSQTAPEMRIDAVEYDVRLFFEFADAVDPKVPIVECAPQFANVRSIFAFQ